MADGDGLKPQPTADKSLGEIVNEVSDKTTLLIREEIELAKAEVATSAKRLGAGAGVGAAAGVFLVFAFSIFFHAVAWFFNDLLNVGESVWIGFLISFGILVLLAAIAGFLAYRFFKKGSPPTPQMAIEEAKATRQAIEEVRR
jgi:Putative Actinobacterial Holin-X, holin superfamily III